MACVLIFLCGFVSPVQSIAEPAAPMRLNSLVTEILNTNAPGGTHELRLDQDGWLFIRLDGAPGDSRDPGVRVTLQNVDGHDAVLSGWGETMRHRSAGPVRIEVSGPDAGRARRLTVRRIPDILMYRFRDRRGDGGTTVEGFVHSWATMEQSILHSTTTLVSHPEDVFYPHVNAWQARRGGRYLMDLHMNVLRESEEVAETLIERLEGTPWGGIIFDEFISRLDGAHYARYAEGLRAYRARPESEGKTMYFFAPLDAMPPATEYEVFIPDSTTSAQGDGSLRMEEQPALVVLRTDRITLDPNKTYTLSAWMRTEECVPGHHTGIKIINRGWSRERGHISPPAGTHGWMRYSKTFVPPESRGDGYQIIIAGPAGGTVWIDGIQLEEGARATAFEEGEKNLAPNPRFDDGLSGWLRGAEDMDTVMEALIDLGYVIAPEHYFYELETEAIARGRIESRLVSRVDGWRKRYPGLERSISVIASAGNARRYTNDWYADVNYKVFLDLQFHTMANHPAFEDIGGVGLWAAHYIDEELLRWYGALFRHYAIEGRRDRLTDDPYRMHHLTNPQFFDGLAGWSTKGNVAAVSAHDMPCGQERFRHAAVPRGSVVRTQREPGGAPTGFSQGVRNLEPGRLYSLKYYVTNPACAQAPIPASARIKGAEVLPEHDASYVWRLNGAYWNMHYRVFRAVETEATLTIGHTSEVEDELYWDFVQIEPWFQGARPATARPVLSP